MQLNDILIIGQAPYFAEYAAYVHKGLIENNIEADLLSAPPTTPLRNKTVVLIGPHLFQGFLATNPALKNIVIGIQTEQLPTLAAGGVAFCRGKGRWLRHNYHKFDWMFDWSMGAVQEWSKRYPRLSWLPHGAFPFSEKFAIENGAKQYDALFLGDPSGIDRRRQVLLNRLSAQFKLYPFDKPIWGEEKAKAIASSRVLINIHFDHAFYLEAPRIFEAASSKICILSEHMSNPFPFRANIDYCDAFYDQIEPKLEFLLGSPPTVDKFIENAFEVVSGFSREKVALNIIEKINLEKFKCGDARYRFFETMRHLTNIGGFSKLPFL